MVDRGFHASRRDYAVQTLEEVPYNQWVTTDPEDKVRFYALRLAKRGW